MCQGGVDSQAPRAILKKQHYSRLDEVSQVHHMQLTETATQTMEFEFDMANFAAEVSLVIPDIHLVSSVFGFHVPVECPLSAVIHLSLMPGAVLQCTRRPAAYMILIYLRYYSHAKCRKGSDHSRVSPNAQRTIEHPARTVSPAP